MKKNGKNAGKSSNSIGDVCPVSGLKIIQKPEWTNIHLADGYAVTFQFIGDRIIRTMPQGFCGNQGLAPLFRERDKVIRQMIGGGEKYVELRDYAGVRGRPNRLARKQMVQGLRASGDRLLGLVNFNMPPPVRIVASVGMRLYRFPFHVSIAADYQEAVNRALGLLVKNGIGDNAAESSPHEFQAGSDGRIDQYIDELVHYVGSINWETEGIDVAVEKKDRHPFKPVFDAIDLVKTDLDDLIDEREQSTRNLLAKEAEQRSIIESIEEGYYECDLAGNMLVANGAFCRICGFAPKATIGNSYRQGLDEINAGKVFETFNQVYRTGVPARSFAYEIIRPDGNRCHVEVSATLIRDKDGQATGFRGIVRDISERRKTEESLMMFRRFAEASGDGMGWSDLDGRIVYVNDTMCRILGETDLASATGKYVTGYYDRETKKQLVHEITPLVIKNGEWKGELLLRKNSGEQVSTLNDLFLIRDEAGQPLYHAIISRDISDLKKAEQALRESEEKYRVLFDHAGDAIFVAQDGVIKFPNLQGLAIFGYTKEELSSNRFVHLIHPDDRDMILNRYTRRLKGEELEPAYSFRIFNKAKELLWVQITDVLIEWAGRRSLYLYSGHVDG